MTAAVFPTANGQGRTAGTNLRVSPAFSRDFSHANAFPVRGSRPNCRAAVLSGYIAVRPSDFHLKIGLHRSLISVWWPLRHWTPACSGFLMPRPFSVITGGNVCTRLHQATPRFVCAVRRLGEALGFPRVSAALRCRFETYFFSATCIAQAQAGRRCPVR